MRVAPCAAGAVLMLALAAPAMAIAPVPDPRIEAFSGLPSNPGAKNLPEPVSGMVPEPATWAMLIAGFGMVGLAARRRRQGALSA